MKLRHALRGIVWMLIGVGIHIYDTATGAGLKLRWFEGMPFAYVVIATGAVIMLVDLWRGRKEL